MGTIIRDDCPGEHMYMKFNDRLIFCAKCGEFVEIPDIAADRSVPSNVAWHVEKVA